jgi:predicted small lipoprotein YifL
MKIRVFGALALAVALVPLTACGSSTPLVVPTAAPTLTTETFNGTVDPLGVSINAFTVAVNGEVDVTLTAAGPPPTIQMIVAVGVPSGTSCAILTNGATLTAAGTTPQLTGTLPPGSYCVQVSDNGNQLVSITYTVTVTHP